MSRTMRIALLTGTLCTMTGVVAGAQLGSIVRGGVVVVAVDRFGRDINRFVNDLMGQRGATSRHATKVVPILSIGDSGYIGAVQVVGPQQAVDRVRGVAQLEGRFRLPVIERFRIRGLVPVDTNAPHRGFSRVEGVGVSAIIDLKL
ncbi:MAG TPA: hypothetical protein VLH79_11590 [Chthonomonadales bacterium]|nr:hypothetical protein [Chthonomonadales bacterium]